jgi:hypothetical protein
VCVVVVVVNKSAEVDTLIGHGMWGHTTTFRTPVQISS